MNDRLHKLWSEWRSFVVFVVVMLIFRSAIADWNQVPSGSMKPSILPGDRIVVDKLAYDLAVPFTWFRILRWGEPKRGDVVTFDNPRDERLFVKRVVGVPGDVVELRRNQLFINGNKASYDPLAAAEIAQLPIRNANAYRFFRETVLGDTRVIMVNRRANRSYSTFSPQEVPAGYYMMLGDNRDNSSDSRRIGLITRDRIMGRAHAVAFSVDLDNYYLPRLARFFTDLP
ncbi:MAG: signal peptidase I [Pseudomonadales bacterium]